MRVWLAAAALALVGCKAEVPENRFGCTLDSDCPPDMVCRADNRCWRTGGGADAGSDGDSGAGPDAGCVDGCGPACITCAANQQCNGVDCECLPDFADCDGALGCESHLPSDRENCGACGMACDVEPACLGGECGACARADQCPDDGLDCTEAPTCAAGVCEHQLQFGYCLIDGACVEAAALNPANQCEHCDPDVAPYDWVEHALPCDDGLFCTDGDYCMGGLCAAGADRDCSGGMCDESRDRCCGAVGQACCADGSKTCAAGCGVVDPMSTLVCCYGVVTMPDTKTMDCPCC